MLRTIILLCIVFYGIAASVTGAQAAPNAESVQTFFVAPKQVGDGRGVVPESAADFRDLKFWSVVRQAVQERSVVVNFLDGRYFVSADEQNAMPQLFLADLGHHDHTLVLQGASKDGVVFTRLDSDSMDGKKGPGFFKLTRSENVIVRNCHFTGRHPISYATSFGGNKNVRIEDCSWIDLPGVYYGATGTSEQATDHVTFANCVFKRVGSGGHAHMAYNAYGARHVAFINCHFEDCAGDYVRFRDRTDFGIVAGCTFKSTGNYRGVNMPFVSVPLFNDDDPAAGLNSPNYEYFGTHFLIFDNEFIYDNDKAPGTRVALLFHHSGFDPPDRRHLLTRDEAKAFENGTAADKKVFMLEHFGVDVEQVHFFRNRFEGTELSVAYRSGAAFGAKSKGWSGIIDVTSAVNNRDVVKNAEQALKYFD
jgi:hypothetical protein